VCGLWVLVARLAWTAKAGGSRGRGRGVRRAYQRIVVQVRVRVTPINALDTSDHRSAKPVDAGRLDRGDDVVGTGYILGPLHAVDAPIAWATWPALPTSVWMSTYALGIPALSSRRSGGPPSPWPTPALTSAWVVPDHGMGMLPEAGRPAGPGFGSSTSRFRRLTRRPVGCWHADGTRSSAATARRPRMRREIWTCARVGMPPSSP
jgi:hypothetical protein